MTGLDPSVDELVEVAVVITDFELEVLDPGLQIVIKPSDAALEQMGDFVRQMHATSGLDAELEHGVSLAEAELEVLEYVQRFVPLERTAPLGGNTIGTDRMFIAKYMPTLDGFLHYRSIDVSSIKELSRRWFPRAYFHESIRELRYYRRAVFTDAPGRSSEELQSISREVSEGFGALQPE